MINKEDGIMTENKEWRESATSEDNIKLCTEVHMHDKDMKKIKTTTNGEAPFKIVEGKIPSTKVYEDDMVLAFKDINPAAPIHILVIPKKHIDSLSELKQEDKDIVWHIHEVINKIAEEQGFKDNGFRVIINCGKDSGQEVMHLHYHVLAGVKMGDKIV